MSIDTFCETFDYVCETFDYAGIVLDRITSTPGVVSHEIVDGILYLHFENGGVVDMTLPLVNNDRD